MKDSLYTFLSYPSIPTTTNSHEDFFSQLQRWQDLAHSLSKPNSVPLTLAPRTHSDLIPILNPSPLHITDFERSLAGPTLFQQRAIAFVALPEVCDVREVSKRAILLSHTGADKVPVPNKSPARRVQPVIV